MDGGSWLGAPGRSVMSEPTTKRGFFMPDDGVSPFDDADIAGR